MSKSGPFPQIGFRQGGNPLLIEEEGKSYTIGARYMPQFLPGFALSIDYYDIEVSNLIAPPSAQAILNACYDSPSGVDDNPYCDAIQPQSGSVNLPPSPWSRAASTMLAR